MANLAIKESTSRKVFLVCNTIFFGLILFLCLYPMWYVLIQSLSSGDRSSDAVILPVGLTLQNYAELLKMPEIFNAFGISVLRTVLGTFFSVFPDTVIFICTFLRTDCFDKLGII